MCAVPACTVKISEGEATNCRSWQKTGDKCYQYWMEVWLIYTGNWLLSQASSCQHHATVDLWRHHVNLFPSGSHLSVNADANRSRVWCERRVLL